MILIKSSYYIVPSCSYRLSFTIMQVFSERKSKKSNSLYSRIFWPVQRRKLQRTFHSKRVETYMFAKKVLTLSMYMDFDSKYVHECLSVRSIQRSKSSLYLLILHRKKLFPRISYFLPTNKKKSMENTLSSFLLQSSDCA